MIPVTTMDEVLAQALLPLEPERKGEQSSKAETSRRTPAKRQIKRPASVTESSTATGI